MIRPAARALMRGLGGAVAALTVVLLVLSWLLSSGPVSLSFLTPFVQAGLKRLELPFRIEFADTELIWGGWDRRLGLQITDVRLIDVDDRTVATVPSLTVDLGLRRLLEGVIVPTSLELVAPRLAFTWTGEGGELLTGNEGSSQLLANLVRELLAPTGAALTRTGLRSISARGAEVTVVDQVRDLVWRADQANILLSPDGEGPAIQLDADLSVEDRARGATWHVHAGHLELARGATGPRVRVSADVPLGGETAHVQILAILDTAAGTARADGQFTPIMPATLAARLPGLDPVAHVRVPIGGTFGVDLDLQGRVQGISFDLFGAEGSLGLPGVIQGEYPVRQLLARGRLLGDRRSLDLHELMLDLGGPMASAWGTVIWEGDHPAIDIVAEMNGLTIADVIRCWPPTFSPKSRQWIAERITAGKVPQGMVRFHATAAEMAEPFLPPHTFYTRFDIRGATVSYLTGLPPATDLSGSATMANGTIDIRLPTGRSGRLALSNGQVRLTGVDHDDEADLAIAFTANGPAKDAIELINVPRLRFGEKFGVDVPSVGGDASGRVGFKMPIHDRLSIEQVEFDATIALRRFQSRGVLGGRSLSDADLKLAINRRGLVADGTGAIDGVLLALTWESRFGDEGPFAGRYRFQTTVDDRGRMALGYDDGERLNGPVRAVVHLDVRRDQRREIHAELDLTAATFALPELHWTKSPGTAGTLAVDLTQANATAATALAGFRLTAPDFSASGRGELDPASSAVRRLVIDRLIHEETDVALTVFRANDGSVLADVRGRSLDVRPFIEGHQKPAATSDLPRVEVKAEVENVIGIGRAALRGVRAELDWREGRFHAMALDGVIGEGAAIVYRLRPVAGGRDLTLTAEDGGALLRWYGAYENALGGKLNVTARIDDSRPDRPVKGRLVMTDFRVMNAPTLANVLTIASLPDFVRALRGEGIAFEGLEGDFVWADDGVQIENARSYGSQLGLTMRGRVDLVSQASNLAGTIVPAYTLNTALGYIPLLGRVLVGGEKGSGVFALTYSVTGPVGEPKITVNPLSFLAPGFLRHLFLPNQQPDLKFLQELERQRPDG